LKVKSDDDRKISENDIKSKVITTDLSKQEQMTICLHYVSGEKVWEDFIDYVSVNYMTGEGLADAILGCLCQLPQ